MRWKMWRPQTRKILGYVVVTDTDDWPYDVVVKDRDNWLDDVVVSDRENWP